MENWRLSASAAPRTRGIPAIRKDRARGFAHETDVGAESDPGYPIPPYLAHRTEAGGDLQCQFSRKRHRREWPTWSS